MTAHLTAKIPVPTRIVVMGVSGSGKSTVGEALAQHLGLPFADADDLHPDTNIAKMSAGNPLNDSDREPWLVGVGAWIVGQPEGGVMGCSALRRSYRDVLRAAAPGTVFLHLTGDPLLLKHRLSTRGDHFMPTSLIESQLDTLEPLEEDEEGAELDFQLSIHGLVEAFLASSP